VVYFYSTDKFQRLLKAPIKYKEAPSNTTVSVCSIYIKSMVAKLATSWTLWR